jgi:hypothetical protein
MRRRLYIPDKVKIAIKRHVKRAADRAAAEYLSAHEDEDTLTGHFGALLKTGWHSVTAMNPSTERLGVWRWSVDYHKFRGRGKKAPEKLLGADGVFELSLSLGGQQDKKSLLFQAKTSAEGGKHTLEQLVKLTTWREAAFVLLYRPTGFRALPIDDALAARGRFSGVNGVPLESYLGGEFIDCEVGDNELQYDAQHRRLYWRSMDGERVAIEFSIPHRIKISVRAPRGRRRSRNFDRLVRPEQLHEFRMEATEAEMLSLGRYAEESLVKQAQRRLSLTYHPDKFSELDIFLQQLMTRRMQEVNASADKLRGKK